jgi:hypothetical protein
MLRVEWKKATNYRGMNKKLNAQPNREEIEVAGIEEEYQPWDGYSASNSLPTVDSQTYSTDSEVMHILALE